MTTTTPRLWANFTAQASHNIAGLHRLKMRAIGTFDPDDTDELAFADADLEQLRQLIDQILPRGEHNHEATDPDAHVIFDSVCCGAQLYRCIPPVVDAFDAGPFVPTKPIIAQGESSCRVCGAELAQF